MYCNSEFACALYFLKALFSNILTTYLSDAASCVATDII